eukprot:COSAG02_NODE_81_length_39811_cov_51.728898_4_plen_108_part_00
MGATVWVSYSQGTQPLLAVVDIHVVVSARRLSPTLAGHFFTSEVLGSRASSTNSVQGRRRVTTLQNLSRRASVASCSIDNVPILRVSSLHITQVISTTVCPHTGILV